MAVEMFDYLDDVIALQATSKTNTVQPNPNHITVQTILFPKSFQLADHIPRKLNDIRRSMPPCTTYPTHPRL